MLPYYATPSASIMIRGMQAQIASSTVKRVSYGCIAHINGQCEDEMYLAVTSYQCGKTRGVLWLRSRSRRGQQTMRIKDRILNTSEEIVLKELSAIVAENRLRVFPKLRLSDVIEKDSYLDRDHFSYFTRSHFDFLITTSEAKPFMAIEYDGPFHSGAEQAARDEKKHFLCMEAELPILRINANHVLRTYRGMTLLRWIIEVIQLEEWFYEAQEKRGSSIR